MTTNAEIAESRGYVVTGDTMVPRDTDGTPMNVTPIPVPAYLGDLDNSYTSIREWEKTILAIGWDATFQVFEDNGASTYDCEILTRNPPIRRYNSISTTSLSDAVWQAFVLAVAGENPVQPRPLYQG